MVALSRLKATFEAWKSNFRGLSWAFWTKYEHMGSQLANEWHVVTAPRCEAHRATSKDVRVTVHSSKSNMGLRKMHERWPPESAGPAHAGNLVLKREENNFFSGSDGGLSTGVWTGRFTGFSTTSSTLTLWILSEHSQPQPAWCDLPLLLYSTQHLHPFTGRNSCGHSPFLMRTSSSWKACSRSCQPMAYLACVEGFSFKADSMEDLAAKKIESGRNRKRMDNLPIGQVQWSGFFSSISSLLLWLLSEFSSLRAALSGQQELHSRLCGDHLDASQQSSPKQ